MSFKSLLPVLAIEATLAVAQTGVAVPEFATLDQQVADIMARAGIHGGSVAIAKDGRLVYARGFGVTDMETHEAVRPDSLFRIGSVSKSVTAAAILTLVEDGRLSLDDKVFGGILIHLPPPPGAAVDPRLRDITVRQLLHHTGGHGRDTGVDPLYAGFAQHAASVLHAPLPPSFETITRAALALPLDFTPGAKFSYSNFGFMILARVIEKVSGQSYETYVRQRVLLPMQLTGVTIGRTLPADRQPGEVHYYDVPGAPLAFSLFPKVRRLLPVPYANWEFEAADGAGWWIASAADLVRFACRLQGLRQPALLRPETFRLMLERPDPFVSDDPTGAGRWWYGLGTSVIPYYDAFTWTHGGGYPGSRSEVLSLGNGFVYAWVFNGRPLDEAWVTELDNILIAIGNNQTDWPEEDLFPRYYKKN